MGTYKMVSVVVDNYNRSDLLPFLIRCYMWQRAYICPEDLWPMEMVIVDDDSNDHFEDYLRLAIDTLKPDFPIRAFETHKSVTFNPTLPLNIGVKQAKGDLIVLNHSDVFPLNGHMLHHMWRYHQEHQWCALVSDFLMFWPNLTSFGSPTPNGLSLPKALFERVHGYDEGFYGGPSSDFDVVVRIGRQISIDEDSNLQGQPNHPLHYSYTWVWDEENPSVIGSSSKDVVFAHMGHLIGRITQRMDNAPWKPMLGYPKEEHSVERLSRYNNDRCTDNGNRNPCVNPSGWGELDTLEEIKL